MLDDLPRAEVLRVAQLEQPQVVLRVRSAVVDLREHRGLSIGLSLTEANREVDVDRVFGGRALSLAAFQPVEERLASDAAALCCLVEREASATSRDDLLGHVGRQGCGSRAHVRNVKKLG